MTAVAEKSENQQSGSAGGRVVRVIGPVVDVEFGRDSMPELNAALTVEITLPEVAKTYTRLANQARQAEITQEISEIVGGADALASAGSDY